jgi:hypothetical protein
MLIYVKPVLLGILCGVLSEIIGYLATAYIYPLNKVYLEVRSQLNYYALKRQCIGVCHLVF